AKHAHARTAHAHTAHAHPQASVASPPRVGSMEGPLGGVEARRGGFHCFLISDLFVRTEAENEKKTNKRKSEKKTNNKPAKDGCVWKGEVPLGNVALVALADTPSRRNAFQVPPHTHHRTRTTAHSRSHCCVCAMADT